MVRKINGQKYYLIIAKIMLCLFFPSALQAQTEIEPPYGEIGQTMGTYMCRSLLETKTVADDKTMAEFVNELVEQYGETTTSMVVSQMEQMFEKSGEIPNQNSIELMRGIFQYVSSDAVCFELFVKEEMF